MIRLKLATPLTWEAAKKLNLRAHVVYVVSAGDDRIHTVKVRKENHARVVAALKENNLLTNE